MKCWLSDRCLVVEVWTSLPPAAAVKRTDEAHVARSRGIRSHRGACCSSLASTVLLFQESAADIHDAQLPEPAPVAMHQSARISHRTKLLPQPKTLAPSNFGEASLATWLNKSSLRIPVLLKDASAIHNRFSLREH